jgi:hypothetical protein
MKAFIVHGVFKIALLTDAPCIFPLQIQSDGDPICENGLGLGVRPHDKTEMLWQVS